MSSYAEEGSLIVHSDEDQFNEYTVDDDLEDMSSSEDRRRISYCSNWCRNIDQRGLIIGCIGPMVIVICVLILAFIPSRSNSPSIEPPHHNTPPFSLQTLLTIDYRDHSFTIVDRISILPFNHGNVSDCCLPLNDGNIPQLDAITDLYCCSDNGITIFNVIDNTSVIILTNPCKVIGCFRYSDKIRLWLLTYQIE